MPEVSGAASGSVLAKRLPIQVRSGLTQTCRGVVVSSELLGFEERFEAWNWRRGWRGRFREGAPTAHSGRAAPVPCGLCGSTPQRELIAHLSQCGSSVVIASLCDN